MGSDASQDHRISILGKGPKSLSERAENAPLATHSDDLKGGVHDPVFLDPFGFKEVGPFLSHFYNTWSPKPLLLESVPHNHFGPTDASEGRNRHQEQHWCAEA